MRNTVAVYLPWLLSAITIWMTVLAGNLHRNAWMIGIVSQSLWLLWIIVTETWGFVPLNVALWIVYIRNHVKWNEKVSSEEKEALEAQRQADYPHCELGLKECRSLTCGCYDTRGYRKKFVQAYIDRNRRSAK